MEALVGVAAEQGAGIIVLPEAFLSAYRPRAPTGHYARPDVFRFSVDESGSAD